MSNVSTFGIKKKITFSWNPDKKFGNDITWQNNEVWAMAHRNITSSHFPSHQSHLKNKLSDVMPEYYN
jgi:hypothetical protein